jgi:2'-5' RNA ligase
VAARKRPGSPRLRLFVALELPGSLLDRLLAWRGTAFGEAEGVRLLPRGSLHATLVFLGYQAERDLERIVEAALSEPGAPFELCAEQVVGVPRGRPRLYALSLADRDGSLGRWQASLAERLERARLYEPEKRPFWPHVTLARVRQGKDRPRTPFAPPELPAELRSPFRARRVTLYRSRLERAGAVYEALAGLELPGPA